MTSDRYPEDIRGRRAQVLNEIKPFEDGSSVGSESGNLSDGVYQALKRKILQCILAPGDLIVEAGLARQFGVSRTPVREALRRLMQDGYVSVSPGSRYRVTPITVRDVQEVFSLRVVLEGEAAELATSRISMDTLDELEQLLLSLLEMDLQSGDDDHRMKYLALNYSFHMTIADAAGNNRLAHLISSLLEEASRYVYLESAIVGTRGSEESLRVIEAAREGDALRAREYMEEHIRATRQRTVGAILSGGLGEITVDS